MSAFNRFQQWAGALAAAAVMGAAASQSQAVVVLSENWDGYADDAAAQAVWGSGVAVRTSFTGNNLDGVTPTTAQPVDGKAALLPNTSNSSRNRALSVPIVGSFTLSFDALLARYSRSLRVSLLDAAGTSGYQVFWSGGGSPAESSSQGTVDILQASSGFGGAAPDAGNTAVAVSGHYATGYQYSGGTIVTPNVWDGFAHFDLTYTYDNASSGTLVLAVDGVVLKTVTDVTPLTDFTQIALFSSGSNSVYFDNIVVDVVPEPASLGLLTLGGLTVLGRRRSA